MAEQYARISVDVPVEKEAAALKAVADVLDPPDDDEKPDPSTGTGSWSTNGKANESLMEELAELITGGSPKAEGDGKSGPQLPERPSEQEKLLLRSLLADSARAVVPEKELAANFGTASTFSFEDDLPEFWKYCLRKQLAFPLKRIDATESVIRRTLSREEFLSVHTLVDKIDGLQHKS